MQDSGRFSYFSSTSNRASSSSSVSEKRCSHSIQRSLEQTTFWRFVDPIVGSWIIHVTVDTFTPTPSFPLPFKFDNLAAFWEDGIITTSDPSFGTGYGVWKKSGPPRTYDTKFLVVVPPGLGYPPGTIQTIFADNTALNPQGDHMRGPFHGFSTDPTGKVIDTFEGKVEDDRITFSKP
jgi:hypothetical protein